MTPLKTITTFAFVLAAFAASAADYPAPTQGNWAARDFKFHTGEVMPALRLHQTTVGELSGQAVLVLHGTGGADVDTRIRRRAVRPRAAA